MRKRITSIMCVVLCLIAFGVYAGSMTDSGKTASDIVTDVRQILNETTASFWSDAMILDWIDAGTREIVAKTKCLQDTTSINLATGTSHYTWTGVSGYMEIVACMYYDGNAYKSMTFTDVRMPMSTGPSQQSPQYCYEWEGKIGIWPVPTAPYSGTSVFVRYIPIPSPIGADGDDILTPSMFDDALVWYAVSHAKMRDNKPEEAKFYMNLFDNIVSLYRQDFLFKQRNPSNANK